MKSWIAFQTFQNQQDANYRQTHFDRVTLIRTDLHSSRARVLLDKKPLLVVGVNHPLQVREGVVREMRHFEKSVDVEEAACSGKV